MKYGGERNIKDCAEKSFNMQNLSGASWQNATDPCGTLDPTLRIIDIHHNISSCSLFINQEALPCLSLHTTSSLFISAVTLTMLNSTLKPHKHTLSLPFNLDSQDKTLLDLQVCNSYIILLYETLLFGESTTSVLFKLQERTLKYKTATSTSTTPADECNIYMLYNSLGFLTSVAPQD